MRRLQVQLKKSKTESYIEQSCPKCGCTLKIDKSTGEMWCSYIYCDQDDFDEENLEGIFSSDELIHLEDD